MAEWETTLRCIDAKDDEVSWSCIEYDGTGLWCGPCLAFAGLLSLFCPQHAGARTGTDQ